MERARVVGKLVYLRPLEREDINDRYLSWMNDTSVIAHLMGATFPVTRDGLQKYYEDVASSKDSVIFAICDKESGVHIGNARLSYIDWIGRTAVYGWLIGDREYRQRGFGADALIQLLKYGFYQLGMNRIWAPVLALNKASLRSSEKAGLKKEGVLREFAFVNGRFDDAVAFSMLRREFDEIHAGPWTEVSR